MNLHHLLGLRPLPWVESFPKACNSNKILYTRRQCVAREGPAPALKGEYGAFYACVLWEASGAKARLCSLNLTHHGCSRLHRNALHFADADAATHNLLIHSCSTYRTARVLTGLQ